jgi:hypothetical protein
MIISIDRSPLWRAGAAGQGELARILEALFRSRPLRRPASGLEVLFLASALECSEAAIEQHVALSRRPRVIAERARDGVSSCPTRISGRKRLRLMQSPTIYSTTKPT